MSEGPKVAGYSIGRMIGRGGMATVYEARRDSDGLRVALKVIAPHLAADREFRERFAREARAASRLVHPHAVAVVDAAIDPEAGGFLAMELVDGPNLDQRIREEGPLPVADVLRVLEQVAGALDEAHRLGLVHRDVKPANILLDEHGAAYLSDFGAAHDLAATRLTTAGGWLGTLDYAAPEQIEGGPIDARTDVYALAAVAFHALSGSVPFPRSDPMATMWAHLHEERPSLPPDLFDHAPQVGAEIARGMAVDPGKRHRYARELVRGLAAAREGATAQLPHRRPAAHLPHRPSVDAQPSGVETVKMREDQGRRLLGPIVYRARGRSRWMRGALAVLALAIIMGGYITVDPLRGGDDPAAMTETSEGSGASADPADGVEGDAGTADAQPGLPDVVGDRLDLAKNTLEAAGYEPRVVGGGLLGVIVERNWVVCGQRLLDEISVEVSVDRACPG